VSTTAYFSDSLGKPSRPSQQSRSKTSIHSSTRSSSTVTTRRHPSRYCTPFFVWKTLLRRFLFEITFTIEQPADTTNATTVSPCLQAVRDSQTTLSAYMASEITKADMLALPIPAERVTLRIANAAVVFNTFTTAHQLPSLRSHRCTHNNWSASTYFNIHWPAFSRSFIKRKLTSQFRV
jgi:hypothetical protein